MKKAILGKKLGMTQIFGSDGLVIPVTVVEAGPCFVTQVKTVANDGYEAVQLAYGDVKESAINKPMLGQLQKAKQRVFIFFRIDCYTADAQFTTSAEHTNCNLTTVCY